MTTTRDLINARLARRTEDALFQGVPVRLRELLRLELLDARKGIDIGEGGAISGEQLPTYSTRVFACGVVAPETGEPLYTIQEIEALFPGREDLWREVYTLVNRIQALSEVRPGDFRG